MVAAKGGVDLGDAHIIDLAVQAEAHAATCRWILYKDRKDVRE